jgi:hypothetical protein
MWRPRARSLQALSGWLTVLGAVGLFASLFLSWSHQLPASVLAVAGSSPALRGVPHDPTAWQVYSIVDVLLALLAGALLAVALAGRSRRARVVVLIGGAIAFAFVVHALSVPPTNGVLVLNPVASSPQYVQVAATSASGEVVALVALIVSGVGLVLSLATD